MPLIRMKDQRRQHQPGNIFVLQQPILAYVCDVPAEADGTEPWEYM